MCWNDHSTYSEPLMPAVPLEALIERYLRELQDAGIPDPLGERFTLAVVLADLCQLAEVPPPAPVLALVGQG